MSREGKVNPRVFRADEDSILPIQSLQFWGSLVIRVYYAKAWIKKEK